MKVLKFENKKEASLYAANMVLDRLHAKPDLRLGLATGSTPIYMYEFLVEDHKEKGTSWSQVITFNLDEYKDMDWENPMSYHYFMKERLFKPLGIKDSQTHFPNKGNMFESLIESHGGIDLQILGIGVNGHIGFNEPGSSEYSLTRTVALDESTIQVNANKFFEGKVKKVPTEAYSMGLHTIMGAREIILLAFGDDKSYAIKKLITAKEFNPDVPATILIKHPNVTVIIDSEVDVEL